MTSSSPSSDTERLLAERYGRRPPGRRWSVVTGVALVAAVALGWLIWAAWSASDPEVEAEVVTWEVVSAHEVEVELVVHRDGTGEVSCTVAAQAADASVVGERVVRVAAGEAGQQRFDVSVVTEREATAVKVSGCE
ncbi:MAG: DUF4307 domain-containing protein [Nocardioidaceae bacterium]